MDAAAELIRERGLANVTTKEIARRARCAEGSIFNRFGDKGGLIAAVIGRALPETRAFRAAGERPGEGPLEERIRRIVEAALAFYRASTPLLGGILGDRELFERYVAAHRERDTGPHEAWRGVAGYLAAERELGRVSAAVDPEAAALMIVGACHHAVLLELAVGTPRLPLGGDELVDRLTRAALAQLT